MRVSRVCCAALPVCLVLIAGCGGGDESTSTDADAGPVAEGRYFPIEVGASWTYRVVDIGTGAVTSKIQTVEALEDVGGDRAGVQAFRLRSQKNNGYTVSWQQDTGEAIVRHHEQSFDLQGSGKTDEWYTPHKLRIDETPDHLAVEASYSNAYQESVTDVALDTTMTASKTESWTVEAVGESVTVPAGTFSCLRLRRVTNETGVQKRYWFARGVGKVREEGGTQIEELTDYSLP